MSRGRSLRLLCAGLLAGCTPAGGAARPGPVAASGDVFYYGDNQGLGVVTAGASVEAPLSASHSVGADVVVDYIRLVKPVVRLVDLGSGSSGHFHTVDAVTGASVTVTGGGQTEETRVEGTATYTHRTLIAGAPLRLQALARVSAEPDYYAFSGRAEGALELGQRATTLSGFVGYGHDLVEPPTAPAGDGERWPAAHDRVTSGVALSQVISPTVVVGAGAAGTAQWGMLASPYRRAQVRTTFFPERLPDERLRLTGHARLAWYAGAGTALHLRQGVYVDSWEVVAVIPEVRLVKELSERALLALGYRFYWQTAAPFYRPVYQDLADILSSDPRLGELHEHRPSVELEARLWGEAGEPGEVRLHAGYALSLRTYPMLIGGPVIAHVVRGGLSGAF